MNSETYDIATGVSTILKLMARVGLFFAVTVMCQAQVPPAPEKGEYTCTQTTGRSRIDRFGADQGSAAGCLRWIRATWRNKNFSTKHKMNCLGYFFDGSEFMYISSHAGFEGSSNKGGFTMHRQQHD